MKTTKPYHSSSQVRTDNPCIANSTKQVHEFPPVWDSRSRILILGSFPSVKSRELGFYYGHPQNRFWKVLSTIFQEEVPEDIPGKRAFLLHHRIALWDVAASCTISGSSDSSIRDVTANDISMILSGSQVSAIFTNGATALCLYRKLILPQTGLEPVLLPSTSPANASWSLDRLCRTWADLIFSQYQSESSPAHRSGIAK
ncbi:MAG: DNA-deoxyinosine glycosylase [Blautia sp.]|nr:DNA-deoxyinosine glycosylase [Blautia sp.]